MDGDLFDSYTSECVAVFEYAGVSQTLEGFETATDGDFQIKIKS